MDHLTDEEGDVCRVCRTEADENDPLIHPCKCSGSVRYVHPGCLKSWLQHSQKRHCEICGHAYTFTKVYPSSLPAVIPTIVYVRQSFFAIEHVVLRGLRIALVIWVWLVALPSCNMFSLRIFLSLGDWISSLEAIYPDDMTRVNSTLAAVYGNLSEPITQAAQTELAEITFGSIMFSVVKDFCLGLVHLAANIMFHPLQVVVGAGDGLYQVIRLIEKERTIANVLRGQVLSIVIAGVLIGLVILREYMQQHNWAGPPPAVQEPINPDEWVVLNGVARRVEDDTPTVFTRRLASTRRRRHASPLRHEVVTEGEACDSSAASQSAVPADSLASAGEAAEAEVEHPALAMRLPLPTFDVDASPARPSAQTPNNDVAFSAPEMLAESSARRPVFWDDEYGRPIPNALAPVALPEADEVVNSAMLKIPDRPPPHTPTLAELQQEELLRSRELVQVSQAGTQDVAAIPGRHADHATQAFKAELPSPRHDPLDPETKTATPMQETGSEGSALPVHDVTVTGESAQPQPLSQTANARLDDSVSRLGASATSPALLIEEDGRDPNVAAIAIREPHELDALFRVPAAVGSPSGSEASQWVDDDEGETAGADDDAVELPEDDELVEDAEDGAVGGDVDAEDGGAPRPDGGVLDELEPGAMDGDDWDGILEVLGLLGPMSAMLQNVCFAGVIMGGCIAVMVGFPSALGKLFLSIDGVRLALNLARLITTIVRYLIEPILQIAIEIIRDVVVAPLVDLVGTYMPSVDAPLASGWSLDALMMGDSSKSDSPWMQRATSMLDGFEALGVTAGSAYQRYRVGAVNLAASRAFMDQMCCTGIGYAIVIVLTVSLLIAGETGLISIPESWLQGIMQYVKFTKLAFFMALEIVCFPLFAGMVILVAVAPLAFEHPLSGLAHKAATLPFGTLFIAWLLGTTFMFAFATGISHIRSICRKGALFFIRDPQDETFSPVREILDKPTAAQLRKLGTSLVTYSVMVFWIGGMIPWALKLVPWAGLAPLRFNAPALSSVPFDLLFLHLAMPPLWTRMRLKFRLKRRFHRFFRAAVHMFGLGPLVLGFEKRFHIGQVLIKVDEKGAARLEPRILGKVDTTPPVIARLFAALDVVFQALFGKYDARPATVRVPARDSIALLPASERRSIFVRLDQSGAPVNPEDKLHLLKQDRACRDAKRDPIKDYEITRLPPHWKTRVYALVISIIAAVSTTLCLLTLGPLVVGRFGMTAFTDQTLHDGYNYILGAGMIWASLGLSSAVHSFLRRLQLAERARRSSRAVRFKRLLMANGRAAYSIILLYGVLPVLVGINWEVYLVMITRYGVKRDAVPVLHVGDAWAMGLTLISIFIGSIKWIHHWHGEPQPWPGRMRRAFRRPHEQAFVQLNQLVLPALGYLLVPIALPWAVSTAIVKVADTVDIELDDSVNAVAFRLMYPITTTILLIFAARQIIAERVERLRQNMVDAEYVLEERVENYAPPDMAGGARSKRKQAAAGGLHAHDADTANIDSEDAGVDADVGEGDSEWLDIE